MAAQFWKWPRSHSEPSGSCRYCILTVKESAIPTPSVLEPGWAGQCLPAALGPRQFLATLGKGWTNLPAPYPLRVLYSEALGPEYPWPGKQ